MTGTTCQQPGCDGSIDGGYCDSCGLAPASGTPAAASGTHTAAAGTGSTRTGSSPTGARTGSRATRRSGTGTGSRSSRRGRLGAGLVDIPAVAPVDPASALMTDPVVEERKRFCRVCEKPVGRSRDGRPARSEGFCPRDGARYSFLPTLEPGVLVAGQYLVQGCLAYGGLGWIYLAIDRNVNDRWVVLKGLLDAGDAAAKAAAAAERRFLAEVNHPNIVTIHNFVEHPGADGAQTGYIVMEYVGGVSLRSLAEGGSGPVTALPLPQVIAYGLEVLPALGYLHGLGLAYSDLKPDNVIQFDRQLKLIDMGAVVPYDAADGFDWYGTPGYQAPEFGETGPSPAADVYTVGRTLAVLALGMVPLAKNAQGKQKPVPLPDPGDSAVLAAHESFHRLLLRATDPDPLRRFDSCDEMADQLGGVLREVLAAEDGNPRPGASTRFGPPRAVFGAGLLGRGENGRGENGRAGPGGGVRPGGEPTGRPDPRVVAAALPVPLVDTDDPAAGLLATASSADPTEILRLAAAPTGSDSQRSTTRGPSTELRLRAVRAHLELGDVATARTELDTLGSDLPGDWRPDWFRGVAALVAREPDVAATAFDTVLATLPGEAAPKLALAAAAECAGDDTTAGHYYRQVGRPDPAVSDAAFGQARVALRDGRPVDALAALDTVAPTSSQHVTAQTVAVRVAVGEGSPSSDRSGIAEEAAVRDAATRLEKLDLDPGTRHDVRASLFGAALAVVGRKDGQVGGAALLGCPWSETAVRGALESELRGGARLSTDDDRRHELVDRANAVRPRSWT